MTRSCVAAPVLRPLLVLGPSSPAEFKKLGAADSGGKERRPAVLLRCRRGLKLSLSVCQRIPRKMAATQRPLPVAAKTNPLPTTQTESCLYSPAAYQTRLKLLWKRSGAVFSVQEHQSTRISVEDIGCYFLISGKAERFSRSLGLFHIVSLSARFSLRPRIQCSHRPRYICDVFRSPQGVLRVCCLFLRVVRGIVLAGSPDVNEAQQGSRPPAVSGLHKCTLAEEHASFLCIYLALYTRGYTHLRAGRLHSICCRRTRVEWFVLSWGRPRSSEEGAAGHRSVCTAGGT